MITWRVLLQGNPGQVTSPPISLRKENLNMKHFNVDVVFVIFWAVVLVSSALVGFEGHLFVAFFVMGVALLGSAVFDSQFLGSY